MDEKPRLVALSIGTLAKDLLRLAKELSDEVWPDKDAQDWYIKGVKDSAHLLLLKWTEHDQHQPPTSKDTDSE